VCAAFALGLAERGVNVVLLARRQGVLNRVAAEIESRTSAQTRSVAIDLARPDAAAAVAHATGDVEIGCLVYCAGADPDFKPFLAIPIEAAEAMVERGRGGIVIFGSGAGLAGEPNMVAYGASKAFDMVFAEALWAELHDQGVDVLGLILGKTDTPAPRQLEHSRGQLGSPDDVPSGATAVDDVIAEAFENLAHGPIWMVGADLRAATQMMGSLTRNQLVRLMAQASAAAMGADHPE